MSWALPRVIFGVSDIAVLFRGDRCSCDGDGDGRDFNLKVFFCSCDGSLADSWRLGTFYRAGLPGDLEDAMDQGDGACT
jgi:hypothetical protein